MNIGACRVCGETKWPLDPPAPERRPLMHLEMCSHRWELWCAWLKARDARVAKLLRELERNHEGYCPSCDRETPSADPLHYEDCELADLAREVEFTAQPPHSPPRCVECGRLENDHPFAHPFTPQSPSCHRAHPHYEKCVPSEAERQAGIEQRAWDTLAGGGEDEQ
jgi:hypothetical protein